MNKEITPPLSTPEELLENQELKIGHNLDRDGIAYPSTWCVKVIKEAQRLAVHYTLWQAAEKAKLSHKTEETKAYLGRAVNSWSEVDKQSILSLEEQIIKDLKL